MSESDHPLYLKYVTLKDGLTGTIVEVYNEGEAFLLELSDSVGLDGLITIKADYIREHYTVRRLRERNQRIVAARSAGTSIDNLIKAFDLSRAQIYRIIKPS